MTGDTPPPPTPVLTAGGMTGPAGWLLRIVHDQRIAFLLVGAVNTAIGLGFFAAFQATVGQWWGYMWTLPFAHVASVLCAFVLYRHLVFRVRGHVWRDLWRFETVYLSALAVNALSLPLLVELGHLPVLAAQVVIVFVTSVMSWVGHRNFSFHRKQPEGGKHP